MTDEELAAIKDRHAAVQESYDARRPAIDHINTCHASVNDVPALVAEIERLRERVRHLHGILKREGWEGPALDDLAES